MWWHFSAIPPSLSLPNGGFDASLTHHAETETALGDDHQAGIYDVAGVISAGGREILHPGIQTRTKQIPLFSPRGKFAYGRKRSGFVLWFLFVVRRGGDHEEGTRAHVVRGQRLGGNLLKRKVV